MMSRTNAEGTCMCVSHQLGPPGSLWYEDSAEEKTVVACPRSVFCHVIFFLSLWSLCR